VTVTGSTSCAAPDQSGVRLGSESAPVTGTVVEGTVQQAGAVVPGAFVRLLDGTGEFVAEVVAGDEGQFRFHTAPGSWTVRALARGGKGSAAVEAGPGANRVDVLIAGH
jgi:hypothetical protein